MENYDNHNLQPKRKRKTKDERLAEIQEKKKKLLAEETRLKQSAINERRKKTEYLLHFWWNIVY